jgi:glycosyltransferase involved in cell wall biosynthesis
LPFFSIIVPTHNRLNLLKRAIDSVFNQTFTDWELIVVDDASKDGTKEWIKAQKKAFPERFRAIVNPQNRERCYSRNVGIEHAKGLYVAFLDSDDYHLPHHLHTLHQAIQAANQPKGLFFTNAYDENEKGERSLRHCPDLESEPLFDYILKYTFNPQRVAIHRDVLIDLKFDLQMPGLEDLDLWLRIATCASIYQVKSLTTIYANHAEAYSANPLRHEKELCYYKRMEKKPELKGRLSSKTMALLRSRQYYGLAVLYAKKQKPIRLTLILMRLIQYPRHLNIERVKAIFHFLRRGESNKDSKKK